MAKAISDFFYAFWWQVYLFAFLMGLTSSVAIGARRLQRAFTWYTALIRGLFYAAATSVLTAAGLALAQHSSSPWVDVLFLVDHLVGFFADGVIFAILFISRGFLRPYFPGEEGLLRLLFAPRTIRAAVLCVGSLYLANGLMKILAHAARDFFYASGYSDTFFFFIALWECVWGIGLWVRRVRIFALCAMTVEMLGAIYTHYHNYFAKGFPEPFGNSLDALRMLTLMSYIAFATVQGQRNGATSLSRSEVLASRQP